MSEEVIPTKEKLAQAIEARRGSGDDPRNVAAVNLMIERARAGYYDEYETELVAPIMTLVQDLRLVGYDDLAQRAIDGDFDCTKEEGEAWMNKEGWDFLRGLR